MQRIKDYVDRFFKENGRDRNYSLTSSNAIAFVKEIQSASGSELLYVIALLFKYGYAKGYRACKAEQRKERGAA